MTDSELELATKRKLSSTGVAPWAYWETELYSIGRCLRDLTGYSSLLPIFASGDHGADRQSKCWPNETQQSIPMYFSWFDEKVSRLKKEYGINAIHVRHPWVDWRRKYAPDTVGSGTVYFVPHSNDSTKPIITVEDIGIHVNSLPVEMLPVTLCIHPYDIKAGLHLTLRSLGMPLTTAGDSSNVNFVKNFYDILMSHKNVVSPNIGAHTFFALEAGKFFYSFNPIEYEGTGLGYVGTGLVDFETYYGTAEEYSDRLRFHSEMQSFGIRNTEFVKMYWESALGINAETNWYELGKLLKQSARQNLKSIPKLYLEAISASLRLIVKNVWRHLT